MTKRLENMISCMESTYDSFVRCDAKQTDEFIKWRHEFLSESNGMQKAMIFLGFTDHEMDVFKMKRFDLYDRFLDDVRQEKAER